MVYNIETDYYGEISERIDVPEAKLILLKYYDLLPEEENHDEELGNKLIEYFKSQYEKVLELLMITKIGYCTLIRLSRTLTPDFWTSQNVRIIRIKHDKLIKAFNSKGELGFCCGDACECKNMLLRYFDLFPEEQNHDEELLAELISILKPRNHEKLDELFQWTTIHPMVLIFIIEQLNNKFFSTPSGKNARDRITKQFNQ
ncbi:MAG: hypothetical protein WDA47_07160 [Bacilli bacterium]